ncbi:AAA family ATPase, partial [bacterium]|nr:AAA family ATPase [bacterium]
DFTKEREFINEHKSNPKTKKENLTPPEDNNDEFQKVYTLLKNGENVFLTGYAGTGKSYILNKLKEMFKTKLTITSTTGISAVSIKGQTLHSWAGVGLCKNPVHKTIEKIKTRSSILKQILNCKILAVDEISMLNIETFEYIDEVLKSVRDSLEPFGGIQVLFIGDFFQLPPVEIDNPVNRKYCFESPIWNDFRLKNVVLKRNYRQSEGKFIKALSNMRTNTLDNEDISLLQERETNLDTFETDILHIFATNDEANRYNLAKFNMIDEPVRIFKATDGVYRGNHPVYENLSENEQYVLEIFGKNCRAEKEIPLKLGARVMLLINMDFNRGLINGSCGTITEFGESTISVKFDNGIIAPIPKHTFEYYYHDKIAAERTQFPLKLAYGITIHKSQGMTLDKLVVDCSRIFERGQAYVAMSRVKTLEGLYLKSFSKENVMADSKVVDFYSNLQETETTAPINQLDLKLE